MSSSSIHASSGVAGGYAFRAGQALPPLLLDDEEALAVAIARQIAAAGTVESVRRLHSNQDWMHSGTGQRL